VEGYWHIVTKMEKRSITKTLVVPTEISVELIGNVLKVKGPKGEIENRFSYPNIKISLAENKITIKPKANTRKFKRIVNTFASHIKNMLQGVESPYIYKLKVCSGHFPMKVTHDKDKIIISNFLGEKIPREALILPNVTVKIDADVITLTSSNKEYVGQSAANIETATKITKRDRRIFQDGCFLMKE